MPDSFSMPQSSFHTHNIIHNGHCWTSQQWHPSADGTTSASGYGTYTGPDTYSSMYTYEIYDP
jgi:hypothetical protein